MNPKSNAKPVLMVIYDKARNQIVVPSAFLPKDWNKKIINYPNAVWYAEKSCWIFPYSETLVTKLRKDFKGNLLLTPLLWAVWGNHKSD